MAYVGKGATCPKCGKLVMTTHPMQTLYRQMIGHLRTAHKLTVKEAERACPLKKSGG